MKLKILIVIRYISLFFLFYCSISVAEEREVVGWLEMSRIYPGDLKIRAKMDTGAKSSSLHAPDLIQFERDGKSWVRFSISDKNKRDEEKKVTIEREISQVIKIKRKEGGADERLVIQIGICIGNIYKEVKVNLVDRSHFNYQLLIGRDDLAENFNVFVNPAATFTKKPKCFKQKKSDPH